MHSNDYEEAFAQFLEQTEYDEAEDALFSLVRLLAALLLPALPAMRRKLPADPLSAAGIVLE